MMKMSKDCRDVALEECDQRGCKCNDCGGFNLSGEDCLLCPKYGCPEHSAEVEIEVEG